MWLTSSLLTLGYLRSRSGDVVALAGCFCGLLAAGIVLRKLLDGVWSRSKTLKTVSGGWRTTSGFLERRFGNQWTRAGFYVTIGFLLGFITADMRQYNALHEGRIHVTGDWTVDRTLRPHQYLIECKENPQGCSFELCPDTPDPGFDVGDRVKVTYTEDDNRRSGRCFSFADQQHTGWVAER